MTTHGRIDEYLEGELSGRDEETFLDHLAGCAECQDALHLGVQLRDREDELRAIAARGDAKVIPIRPALRAVPPATVEASEVGETAAVAARTTEAAKEPAARPDRAVGGDVVSIGAARRRRTTIALVGLAAAAAALFVATRPRTPSTRGTAGSDVQLALAPTRSIEPRLSWAPAAGYRRYDTMRSGTGAAAVERIDPRVIASLDERGDCAGLAATYLLSGELARARAQSDRCGDGPDLDADRAALAIVRGAPAEALALADRALAARADHPVALWNRALALRDLGLGLAAAAAFDRAAADPAWADEARTRAAQARAPLDELRNGYQQVREAGARMVAGGPPIPAPLARAFPARARLRLDDAIRVALTRARLDELRPLAETLEGLAGDGLVARLDAAAPAALPPALVEPYVAWVQAGAITDEAAWQRWLAAARRARADALVLGAVLLTGRGADAPEAAAIAARTNDPWTIALQEVIAIGAAHAAGDVAGADARLAKLEQACAARALPDYPCLRAAHQRAMIEFARYRAPATAAATAEVLRLAGATGEWALRWRALYLAANAERIRGAYALAIAYYDENVLEGEGCESTRIAATVAAEIALRTRRVDEARRRVLARPACGPPTLIELSLEVDLARAGAPTRDAAAIAADLAALAPRDPHDARYAAYLAARVRLGADPAAAEALRAIAVQPDPPSGPGRPDNAQLAAGVLAVEAARAGRWDDAVAQVAAWSGAPVPGACALVLASEQRAFVAVAIDRGGARAGVHEPDRAVDDRRPLPAAITGALAGCPRVDVLALPPWLGADLGLDPALPWRYVTRAPIAAPAGPAHRVIVVEPRAPAALGLAPLGGHVATPPGAEILRGDAATVARVAAAARDATLLEIHAHAVRVDDSDAPAIALADGPGGWAATAERVAGWALPRAPIVLLADCDAGVSARYDELHWGLPHAFLDAGAAAVVAALVPVPDAEADAVFAQLGDAIAAGEPAAAAVARIRAEKIRQDPASWLRHVVVFE